MGQPASPDAICLIDVILKCLKFDICMCIPYAISAVLMMSVPANASETFKYIYIFLTCSFCGTSLSRSRWSGKMICESGKLKSEPG